MLVTTTTFGEFLGHVTLVHFEYYRLPLLLGKFGTKHSPRIFSESRSRIYFTKRRILLVHRQEGKEEGKKEKKRKKERREKRKEVGLKERRGNMAFEFFF